MMMLMALAALLLIVTAFLTLLESILIYVDDVRLAGILSARPPRQQLLKEIVQNKQSYLSSMVLLINLISIGGSAIIGGVAAKYLTDSYLVMFSMLLTYVMLVFAKMLPKLLGPQLASKTLPKASLFLRIIYIGVAPLRWVTMIWARLFKVKDPQGLSIHELKYILRQLNHDGVMRKDTRRALEYVLASESRAIGELSKVADKNCLDCRATVTSVSELVATLNRKWYLLMDSGSAIAVVSHRAILRTMNMGGGDVMLEEIGNDVSFLDANTSLLEALKVMKKNKVNLCVVTGMGQPRTISLKAIYKAVLKKGKK
ncbi:CNNM domain-containing protein [Endozoicomonas ascidiicola]|nr:CNNM domain-containing protein [Endozoicomonas ascidiicola]